MSERRLPRTILALTDVRNQLSAFAKETLTDRERTLLNLAEALLNGIDEPIYVVAWTGGYEDTQYAASTDKEEAVACYDEWTRQSKLAYEESDRIELLEIRQTGWTTLEIKHA